MLAASLATSPYAPGPAAIKLLKLLNHDASSACLVGM
jgi:hypothetical protein